MNRLTKLFLNFMNSLILKIWRRIFHISARQILLDKSVATSTRPTLIVTPHSIPNHFLIYAVSEMIKIAFETLVTIPREIKSPSIYANIFPGEHYRILKALAMILRPQVVVEIGTSSGVGALALYQGMESGIIYTYDIEPWHNFYDTHLNESHFLTRRVVQIIGDLSIPDVFYQNLEILNSADIIFLDAPKDGVFEYKLIDLMCALNAKPNKLLIIDDIKFINMIELWQRILSPKIDVSSIGHGSGTGLVDISSRLELK